GVSPEETRTMERIVVERGGLSGEQAALVVPIAAGQHALAGGTEDYLVTREFASTATREQRLALLDCCMAVAAADADVSITEDDAVREIASAIALSHADFIAARSAYREYLAVLKNPTGGWPTPWRPRTVPPRRGTAPVPARH